MTSAALCSPLTRSLIHWMEFSRFRRGTETFPTQLSALMSPKFSRQPPQITCVLWNQRGAGSGAGGTVMKEAPKLQTHTHTFLVTSCGENEVLQAKTDRNSVIVLIFTRVKWNYVVLMKKLFFFMLMQLWNYFVFLFRYMYILFILGDGSLLCGSSWGDVIVILDDMNTIDLIYYIKRCTKTGNTTV